MQKFLEILNNILGLSAPLLQLDHMIFRTIIVYIASVILFRIGPKRFSKPTALDLVVVLIFGSIVSRAITGEMPFFYTLIISTLLIFLHWICSLVTVYSDLMGVILKGKAQVLIENGEINRANLIKCHISEKDLKSALRLNAQITDPKSVKLAILERNGDISVIPNN